MRNQNTNIWAPPSRMSGNGEIPKLAPIAAPSAPTPQVQQPGVIQQKATDYATKQGMTFMDDTIMPWMKNAVTNTLAPTAVSTGVATAAEVATAGNLGVGIASGAAPGLTGGLAAAAPALMAAAPWVAGAYGLYRLLK